MRTLNSKLTDAEICRVNGWGPGTLLVSKRYGIESTIKITAVGMDQVLAILLQDDGEIRFEETRLTLSGRNWKVRK